DLAEGADVRQSGRAVAGREDHVVLRSALEPRDDLARLLERPGGRLLGERPQRYGGFGNGDVRHARVISERADGEIAQPQVREPALFPQAEQRPVERLTQRVVAAPHGDADPLAEVAALGERAAAELAAVPGIRAVEPEGELDSVAEQQIDLAAAQRLARGLPGGIGLRLRLGEESLGVS